MTVNQILDALLTREGGYADRAADHGGATRYGITAKTLGAWRGYPRPATRAEVQALTVGEAREIYHVQYISRPGFDQIRDPDLQVLLIDIGVTSGPATAIRMLQAALSVMADGLLGPQTLAALAQAEAHAVFLAVLRAREELFVDLALHDPPMRVFLAEHPELQAHNLRGWLRQRVFAFLG